MRTFEDNKADDDDDDDRNEVGCFILPDLLLDDDAAIVDMLELHGILDRDDLGPTSRIDHVDDVIERGGFSHAGGAGDEDESIRETA